VTLTQPVSRSLSGTSFSVDFSVKAPQFVIASDSFGFTFLGSSGQLFKIAFEAPGGGTGDLEIAWYDGAARNVIMPMSLDIFYDSTYTLNVDFTDNGTDAMFSADLFSVTSTMFSGTLTGQASAALTDFGAEYTVVDDGDSFLTFDNISVVPEPSTSLLMLGFASIALLRRRR
jgi:hypothetical protein